jgi:4-amino-4-deoxy-L-arabinose transferase-like glycosyltransferase
MSTGSNMKAFVAAWGVAIAFLVLAFASRLYRLDWSVSGDHTSSFREVRSLTEKPFFLAKFEMYDVAPRTEPVGYALQAISFHVFGTAEAGSRTGSAIAGAVAIGVCVLLVARTYGLAHGVILGAMLVLWPWLLGHNQSNRPPYSYGFLFTSVAILATCVSWRRNSFVWGACAGAFSAIAISTQVISAVVPAGMLGFLLLERFVKRNPVQRRASAGYLALGTPLMLVSVGLAMWTFGPRAIEWGEVQGWGRAPKLEGLAFNVGWSVALLSLVGWVLSWRSEDPTERMWAMVAVMVVAACVFVPFVTAFRPDYVFPSALVFFLLASRVLTEVYEALSTKSRVAAMGVVVAVVLFPLPSFASYYQDGDRQDYRSAAAFINKHLQPGDLVAADTPGALEYYLDVPVQTAGRPSTTAAQTVATLSELASTGRRVWYVCRFAREEPSPEVDRWFWQNALRMLRIKRKRFDYHENILDVYLFNATAETRKRIEEEVPRGNSFMGNAPLPEDP